jgi:hypothetical protein
MSLQDSALTHPNPEDRYEPLPFFPWIERPATLALDVEECRTAIYLTGGCISKAAELLKVTYARLDRRIRKSLLLQKVVRDVRALRTVAPPLPARRATRHGTVDETAP